MRRRRPLGRWEDAYLDGICGLVLAVALGLLLWALAGCGETGRRDRHLNSMFPRRQAVEERFWQHVQKSDRCWEWMGHRAVRGGYGALNIDRRPRGAHRVSWELHFGPIPAGLHVCHRCDNPPCVRPDHLFLGTNADNVRDMNSKGRAGGAVRVGEHHFAAKLSERQVRSMRTQHSQGASIASLARVFGVRWAQAKAIVSRRAWTHVA